MKKLFAEADVIITNPPFSLFREFLKQILDFDKKFLIIGNKNCVTYKEVFPLIKNNKIWSVARMWTGEMWFYPVDKEDFDKIIDGEKVYKRLFIRRNK